MRRRFVQKAKTLFGSVHKIRPMGRPGGAKNLTLPRRMCKMVRRQELLHAAAEHAGEVRRDDQNGLEKRLCSAAGGMGPAGRASACPCGPGSTGTDAAGQRHGAGCLRADAGNDRRRPAPGGLPERAGTGGILFPHLDLQQPGGRDGGRHRQGDRPGRGHGRHHRLQ